MRSVDHIQLPFERSQAIILFFFLVYQQLRDSPSAMDLFDAEGSIPRIEMYVNMQCW